MEALDASALHAVTGGAGPSHQPQGGRGGIGGDFGQGHAMGIGSEVADPAVAPGGVTPDSGVAAR